MSQRLPPVSTTRRVGFTALALVVLWVLGWRAYGLGVDRAHDSVLPRIGAGKIVLVERPIDPDILVLLSLTLVPVLFVIVSLGNSVKEMANWRCLLCIALCLSSLTIAEGAGWHDAAESIIDGPFEDGVKMWEERDGRYFDDWVAQRRASRTTSWAWVVPFVAVTALVTFASWRQAVRDAAVMVEEDEEDEEE